MKKSISKRYNFVISSSLHNKERLDLVLVKLFPSFSRSCIQKWITNGQVCVNNCIILKSKQKIIHGDLISIVFFKFKKKKKKIVFKIIHEDEHLLIIDKPPNLVVHPGIKNTENTIMDVLLKKSSIFSYIPRAGIVHRLDKDTTGLMIIAKSFDMYKKLIKMFKKRTIERTYKGIVKGNLVVNDVIKKPIMRHIKKKNRMMIHNLGKEAITWFKVIKKFLNYTMIELKLKTGRTHQIRVHMEYISSPLVGDQVYYGKNKCFLYKNQNKQLSSYINSFKRQALHACKVQFLHPFTNKKIVFKSSLPKDILDLIRLLKIYNSKENNLFSS